MSRHMSELQSVGTESSRRRLSEKEVGIVEKLTSATVKVLVREGFAGTTMRRIAEESGVATATAYTYFASKEHLIAEIYWRRLEASPRPGLPDGAPSATRVVAVLRQVSLLVADEPVLVGAVSNALLSNDPDVNHLRTRIGREIRARLTEAVGPDDPSAVAILDLLYAGALLHAGIGQLPYKDVADALEISARRLLGDSNSARPDNGHTASGQHPGTDAVTTDG